jgi:hypothetical protein
MSDLEELAEVFRGRENGLTDEDLAALILKSDWLREFVLVRVESQQHEYPAAYQALFNGALAALGAANDRADLANRKILSLLNEATNMQRQINDLRQIVQERDRQIFASGREYSTPLAYRPLDTPPPA